MDNDWCPICENKELFFPCTHEDDSNDWSEEVYWSEEVHGFVTNLLANGDECLISKVFLRNFLDGKTRIVGNSFITRKCDASAEECLSKSFENLKSKYKIYP